MIPSCKVVPLLPLQPYDESRPVPQLADTTVMKCCSHGHICELNAHPMRIARVHIVSNSLRAKAHQEHIEASPREHATTIDIEILWVEKF